MSASVRRPTWVRLALAVTLLIFGIPVGLVLSYKLRDQLWPWARMPAHVVVHVQNDSPDPVTLSYDAATWRLLYPLANPSPLASGAGSHDMLIFPAAGPVPADIELEIMLGTRSPPLIQCVPVVAGEHLLYTIDSLGAVTLARGHESSVGYPIYGATSAVVRGAP